MDSLTLFTSSQPRRAFIACLVVVAAFACDPQGDETGGTPGTSTSQGAMEGPPPPAGLRPRWLLRDSNGEVVKAIVEPHCGDPEDCRIPDIGAAPTFPCVHVTMHEDRYVGMLFGLADGSPLSCHAEPLPRGELCASQPDCSGPFFRVGPEMYGPDRPDAVRTIYRDGDELFFVSSAQDPALTECFYNEVIDGCLSGGSHKMFPVLPVPQDMMNLLAAGAPYTLEAAYD